LIGCLVIIVLFVRLTYRWDEDSVGSIHLEATVGERGMFIINHPVVVALIVVIFIQKMKIIQLVHEGSSNKIKWVLIVHPY